jgi:hypothetical protein
MINMYLYQIDNKLKYIYYVTPKCATRTFFNLFEYKPRRYRQISPNHSDYFSWGFVRNPWDRLVSAYINKIINKHQHGLNVFRHIKSFREFILALEGLDLTTCDRHIQYQYSFLPSSINFIGRLENLQDDFNIVCDKIGIPQKELPHINKSDHKHYTEYYDDETREIVAEKYAKDIEYFGYEFKNKNE